MNPQTTESIICAALSKKIGAEISDMQLQAVHGGSINNAYKVDISRQFVFFCKINSVTKYPALFKKEANGLDMLRTQNIILTPQIIACESVDEYQVLILEWIDQGEKTEKFWTIFGEQLAKLHYVSNNYFGSVEDNYMGALTQSNNRTVDWVTFLIEERFKPQVKLATEKHLLDINHARHFENLYKKLQYIFPTENPSLLHGDLWAGNFICNKDNNPVLIDPAIYFGHRSMDLAMTTLFGGFDNRFYESYNYHYPFPHNHQEQWEICNLYPLLIHLNLFGKSYLSDIIHIIRNH